MGKQPQFRNRGKGTDDGEGRRTRRPKGDESPWQKQLGTAVENGKIRLSPDDPEPDPEPTPVRRQAPTAVSSAKTPVRVATSTAITRAGVEQYDDFFGLLAWFVQHGGLFRPLGFIPGPATIVSRRKTDDGEEEWQVVRATPDVIKRIGLLPTPWMKKGEMSPDLLQALEEWQAIVDELGYEASLFNHGFARSLLEGYAPPQYLAMIMPRFRYRSNDPELPFGVVLVPEGGKMKLNRVHNPEEWIPNVPAVGTVMALAELKDGSGPVQKLLRTWAQMENEYLRRYDRRGNPRPRQTPSTRPQQQYQRPTWR